MEETRDAHSGGNSPLSTRCPAMGRPVVSQRAAAHTRAPAAAAPATSRCLLLDDSTDEHPSAPPPVPPPQVATGRALGTEAAPVAPPRARPASFSWLGIPSPPPLEAPPAALEKGGHAVYFPPREVWRNVWDSSAAASPSASAGSLVGVLGGRGGRASEMHSCTSSHLSPQVHHRQESTCESVGSSASVTGIGSQPSASPILSNSHGAAGVSFDVPRTAATNSTTTTTFMGARLPRPMGYSPPPAVLRAGHVARHGHDDSDDSVNVSFGSLQHQLMEDRTTATTTTTTATTSAVRDGGAAAQRHCSLNSLLNDNDADSFLNNGLAVNFATYKDDSDEGDHNCLRTPLSPCASFTAPHFEVVTNAMVGSPPTSTAQRQKWRLRQRAQQTQPGQTYGGGELPLVGSAHSRTLSLPTSGNVSVQSFSATRVSNPSQNNRTATTVFHAPPTAQHTPEGSPRPIEPPATQGPSGYLCLSDVSSSTDMLVNMVRTPLALIKKETAMPTMAATAPGAESGEVGAACHTGNCEDLSLNEEARPRTPDQPHILARDRFLEGDDGNCVNRSPSPVQAASPRDEHSLDISHTADTITQRDATQRHVGSNASFNSSSTNEVNLHYDPQPSVSSPLTRTATDDTCRSAEKEEGLPARAQQSPPPRPQQQQQQQPENTSPLPTSTATRVSVPTTDTTLLLAADVHRQEHTRLQSPMEATYAHTSQRGCRSHQEDNVTLLPDVQVELKECIEREMAAVTAAKQQPQQPPQAGDDGDSTRSLLPFLQQQKETAHFSCFGVFDGHCGDDVSTKASLYYLEHFQLAYQRHYAAFLRHERAKRTSGAAPSPDDGKEGEELGLHRVLSGALVQSLLHLDVTLWDTLEGRKCHSGSTACIAACALPFMTDMPPHEGAATSGCTTPRGPLSPPSHALRPVPTPLPNDGEVEGIDYLQLSIANLGDSRAVLGRLRDGEVLLATVDHRVEQYPQEATRIKQCGGVVLCDRVDGSLGVTRGLGDYEFKQHPETWWGPREGTDDDAASSDASSPTVSKTQVGNIVSNVADVYEWHVRPGDFLVLCTDGVFDYMTTEEVCQFVATRLRYHFHLGPPSVDTSSTTADDAAEAPTSRSPSPLADGAPLCGAAASRLLTSSAGITEEATSEWREGTRAPPRHPVGGAPASPCADNGGRVCASVPLYPCNALQGPTTPPHSRQSSVVPAGVICATPPQRCKGGNAPAIPPLSLGETNSGPLLPSALRLELTPPTKSHSRVSSTFFDVAASSVLRTADSMANSVDSPRQNALQRVADELAGYVVADRLGADNVTAVIVLFESPDKTHEQLCAPMRCSTVTSGRCSQKVLSVRNSVSSL